MNTIQLQAIDEFSDLHPAPVARCADGNGTLTPLFFSDHVLDIARAKAICAKCALRERVPERARSNERSPGVCGVASCSPAAASSPTSDQVADHRSARGPSSSSTRWAWSA